jgi:hypothetical protein
VPSLQLVHITHLETLGPNSVVLLDASNSGTLENALPSFDRFTVALWPASSDKDLPSIAH